MNRESALHVIDQALREGRKTLSEYEAKQLLAAYRIPVTREILVRKRMEVRKAAMAVGYPLVMKGCSAEIAHKTERGLIRVDLRNDREALKAFDEIKSGMDGQEGDVLMQELIQGRRELVMGMTRDDQFGPCVMFGLGGIFTEILRDVAFRRAPLEKVDALALMDEIRGSGILDGIGCARCGSTPVRVRWPKALRVPTTKSPASSTTSARTCCACAGRSAATRRFVAASMTCA